MKSHGAAYNYDSGPSEMHVRQTELNIELFHETTAHRPEDGIIVYGLAEDYVRLALHRVERRPAVFVEMLGKAAAAFDADSAAEVTAEGVITKQCVICPYRSRCVAAQMRAIPAAGTGGLDQDDAARHRSPRRRPRARRRSRGRGRARPRRDRSRDHRDADRCRRQQDQAQRLRRATEDSLRTALPSSKSAPPETAKRSSGPWSEALKGSPKHP